MDQQELQLPKSERRKNRRFHIQAPAVVTVGSREIWVFTKEVSSCGIYFSLAEDDGGPPIGELLDFVIKVRPKMNCGKPCYIQGRARTIRIDQTDQNETGIAVEILEYAIQSQMTHGMGNDQPELSFPESRVIWH